MTYKKRPALVVQDEQIETGLTQRLVAMITSNLVRTGETRVLIQKDSSVGRAMGLITDSVIMADNILLSIVYGNFIYGVFSPILPIVYSTLY